MENYRVVSPIEVPIKIDEETKLICNMVATLVTNGIEYMIAIRESFKILDAVITHQESRLESRIKLETKRRRGY